MPSLRPLCPRFALHRYAQLRAWGRAFAAEHGRQPRLWIDKWCLDQRRITDTLPCLPIFLGGSQQLVLLVGPTFTQRLWCVIEIFTFMHMGGSAERMCVLMLCTPAGGPSPRPASAASAAPARPLTRELTNVSGVDPPVRHHTLLLEDHSRGGPYRYREFVTFQAGNEHHLNLTVN